jgi:diaminopimelate epimerase
MHGLGNDFILVDDLARAIPDDSLPELAARLNDRHFGIGGDGLILVRPSEVADFNMRVINSDGSEAEMCGNGIRCFAIFLHEHGLTEKNPVRVETGAGVLTLDVHGSNVTVDMGEPRLDRAAIPMAGEGTNFNVPLTVEGREFFVNGANMGNPHAVIFLDTLDGFAWERYGPRISTHSLFPAGTNVHFVEQTGPNEVRVKVWERGAGPTLACGTGACAITVVAASLGKTGRKVRVNLPGGPLQIDWRADNHVFMTGPAVEVFIGEIEV